MKWVLLFIVLYFSFYSHSEPRGLCLKNVKAKLSTVKLKHKVFEQFTINDINNPVYRSSTQRFGTWLMLQKKMRAIRLDIFNNNKLSSYEFDLKSCKLVSSKTKEVKSIGQFTDKKLYKLINKNKTGIIYVWSPRNTYSYTRYEYHAKVAKKLKLKWTPLLVNSSSDRKISNLKNFIKMPKSAYQRLNALELSMRGASLHTPVTFFYKKGQLLDKKLVGVYTQEIYEREINKILQ